METTEATQELEALLVMSYISDRQKEAIIRGIEALKVEGALDTLIAKWKGEE